ncbi:MAG: serine/threonine protein kinase [Proteobacteria bacterium]|nr:serine/threonine protein kinase [Pseudomonadota bacterium]
MNTASTETSDDERTIAIEDRNDILDTSCDMDHTAICESVCPTSENAPVYTIHPSEMDDMEEQTRKHRGLDDLEGEIISGRYQIVRRIGKGGMGVVYLATQTNLGRNVCIKVLNPALLDDEDAVGRFEREAKGLSRLQHPNIVTIFDYGRDGNLAYIVMEYAQGETLSKYLKTHGALTLDQFLPLAVQTLKGIGEAHKLGLIHRDIKPANIVLCELEGEKNYVKILDFGLAKLAQGGEELTKEQQLVGSASYMSPEQILNGISDTRTDVYALGVMFYLMLSGKKPFTGSNDNVILYKHVNETPTPLKRLLDPQQGVPDTLCEVIDQCLSKSPEKRPQTANDLLNAISYALDAPQLRAGFSSMSLASVELQKSEPLLPPTAVPEQKSSKDAAIPQEEQIPEEDGIRTPLHDPTQSYELSTETKDRKILILTLSCVAAIIAIILVVILNKTTEPQTKPMPVVQTTQSDVSALVNNIQDEIINRNWDNADKLMDTLAAYPDAQSEEFSKTIGDLRAKLIREKSLYQAKDAAQREDYDTALALFNKVLDIDPSNEEAIQGKSDILNKQASLPEVIFTISVDRSETELIIDDEFLGPVPEAPYKLTPGTHELTITYKDRQWEKTQFFEANSKTTLNVDFDAPALQEAPAKPAPAKAASPKPTQKPKPQTSDSGLKTNKENKSGSKAKLLGI